MMVSPCCRWNWVFLSGVVIATLVGCAATMDRAAAATVIKRVDGFEFGGWSTESDFPMAGSVSVGGDLPPIRGSGPSLAIESDNTGKPARFGVAPAGPIVIPGRAISVSMWIKLSRTDCGVKVNFQDGWGRGRAENKNLQWEVPTAGAIDQWKSVKFIVPSTWIQPIRITDIGIESPGSGAETEKTQLLISDIEVETDTNDVDPATGVLTTWKPNPAQANQKEGPPAAPITPLLQMSVSTPNPGNVFTGEEPRASIRLRNWKAGSLTGNLTTRVLDSQGKVLDVQELPIQVDGMLLRDIPLKANRFGLDTLEAKLSLSDGTTQTKTLAFAVLPHQRDLTEQEKLASPYGINYHSGGKEMLTAFRKAGIVWFREYAFTYTALMASKGDGSFTADPVYPRMMREYQEIGAEMMPVVQRSIIKPKMKDGKVVGDVGPSAEWVRNMTSAMKAFPQIKFWEVSNEYDLPTENSSAEKAVNWLNYEKYHAALANIAEQVGGGKITIVENGHPGIFPEIERLLVQSGYFDKIGVVNSHHYTGTEAPEENSKEYNTHSDVLLNREPSFFFDQLRESKRAGQSDGKPRQHWLTEFGWDTRAGPVVSEYEQAVFLQRGWMLTMAAGCEKAFWFYNFDEKNPKDFFDGCGLFTYDKQPKPALAAMAGMTSILPSPRYVGMVNVGDNTGGYVFQQDGKLVAVLFAIRGEGPVVNFKCEKLFDYFGNEIDGRSVKLTMAPVYAVGIDRNDPFYLQTAYGLDTSYMMGAAPGDAITPVLEINNNRSTPIDCAISPSVLSGWSAEPIRPQTVAAGERKLVKLPMTVAGDESLGMKTIKITISEGPVIKQISLKVHVHPRMVMKVSPIAGRPGPVKLLVKITNRSAIVRSGVLRLKLPVGWNADAVEFPLKDIAPEETRDISVGLMWTGDLKEEESAIAQFDDGKGFTLSQPIIPPQMQIHEVADLKLDGDLNEWPAETEIPSWMLGCTVGKPQARVHLAWTTRGLCGCLEVHDSKVVNREPENFWTQDSLELFLDTADDKSPREYAATDHQFWFVPMVDQHRVYAGRYKVKNEIPATLLAIPDVKGFSQRTADGYVMEFLLPASLIHNYTPRPGSTLGVNLNLLVKGEDSDREVFWPRSKTDGVQTQQHKWGSVQLTK